MRVAVLCSGSGTNLQALLDAEARGELAPAEIVLVVSNVASAAALERAARAGKPTRVIDHRDAAFVDRAAFDRALADTIEATGVELVVLAGFMRILGPPFLDRFPGRVVNVHPALLPAFPGTHAQRQAVQYGVRIAGCTVHFVDAGVDAGPIIAQAAVPVREEDDEDSLGRRILAEEHRLLPAVVRLIAEGRVRVDGRRVSVSGARVADGAVRSLPVRP